MRLLGSGLGSLFASWFGSSLIVKLPSPGCARANAGSILPQSVRRKQGVAKYPPLAEDWHRAGFPGRLGGIAARRVPPLRRLYSPKDSLMNTARAGDLSDASRFPDTRLGSDGGRTCMFTITMLCIRRQQNIDS